jgi:hypothetical protein
MSNLDDLLRNGQGQDWKSLWAATAEAADFAKLPSGVYEAEATKGELFHSRSGTPGYKLTWKITEGEYVGRLVWQDLWLTPAAMPYTKTTLRKLGLTSPEDSLTAGIVCAVQVVLRTKDDGSQYNEVKRIEYLRREVDPFSPEAVKAVQPTEATTPVCPATEAVQPPMPAASAATSPAIKPVFPAYSAAEQNATKPPASELGETEKPVQPTEASKPPASGLPSLPEVRWTVPEHVKQVSEAVPIGNPVTLSQLAERLPIHVQFIQDALERLREHGIQQEQWRGAYLYYWANKRPALDSSGIDPATVEMSEEEFLRELRGGANGR